MDEKIDRLNAWYAEYKAEGRPGWSIDYGPKGKLLDRVLAKPSVPRWAPRRLTLVVGQGEWR